VGLTKTDSEWSAALDAALMATRRATSSTALLRHMCGPTPWRRWTYLTDEETPTLEEPYSPNGFLTGGDAVPQSRLPRFGLQSLGRSGVNVIQRAKYGGVQ
jgi:hypothetical protein